MLAGRFSTAHQRQIQPLAEPAHPADMAGWYASHQSIGFHVAIDDCSGGNKGVFADGCATDDRAVGAYRCSTFDQRVAILVFAIDRRTRIVNIGEDHARAAENVIFQVHVVVDRDIVLDLDVVANGHAIADKDVLAERAAFTDAGTRTDMDPVPDACCLADLRTPVHDGGRMDLCRHFESTFLFSFSAKAMLVVHLPPKTVNSLPFR